MRTRLRYDVIGPQLNGDGRHPQYIIEGWATANECTILYTQPQMIADCWFVWVEHSKPLSQEQLNPYFTEITWEEIPNPRYR